jgi:hypothetical protein
VSDPMEPVKRHELEAFGVQVESALRRIARAIGDAGVIAQAEADELSDWLRGFRQARNETSEADG